MGVRTATWWDWSLALSKPDWLSEPRGRDVSPSIRWIPVITNGQGHQFGTAPAYAWATILPPAGWTTADTSRLVTQVAEREAPIR